MIVWGCAVIDRKACVRMEQARTEHVMSRTAVRLLFQHPRWSSSLNPSRRHHRALDYQRTETTSPTKSTFDSFQKLPLQCPFGHVVCQSYGVRPALR
jgi:hypothetical protein